MQHISMEPMKGATMMEKLLKGTEVAEFLGVILSFAYTLIAGNPIYGGAK